MRFVNRNHSDVISSMRTNASAQTFDNDAIWFDWIWNNEIVDIDIISTDDRLNFEAKNSVNLRFSIRQSSKESKRSQMSPNISNRSQSMSSVCSWLGVERDGLDMKRKWFETTVCNAYLIIRFRWTSNRKTGERERERETEKKTFFLLNRLLFSFSFHSMNTSENFLHFLPSIDLHQEPVRTSLTFSFLFRFASLGDPVFDICKNDRFVLFFFRPNRSISFVQSTSHRSTFIRFLSTSSVDVIKIIQSIVASDANPLILFGLIFICWDRKLALFLGGGTPKKTKTEKKHKHIDLFFSVKTLQSNIQTRKREREKSSDSDQSKTNNSLYRVKRLRRFFSLVLPLVFHIIAYPSNDFFLYFLVVSSSSNRQAQLIMGENSRKVKKKSRSFSSKSTLISVLFFDQLDWQRTNSSFS